MQPRRQLVVAALALASAAGCVRRLPPAPPPPELVPTLAAPPPAADHVRLIVDVVDGPTAVQRETLGAQPLTSGQPGMQLIPARELLCAVTPCAVDLPRGNVALVFPIVGHRYVETELIHVGPEARVYRRVLSIYEDKTGSTRTIGIWATVIGAVATITGASLLSPGLARNNDGLTISGGITLGVGAALLTGGILAMRAAAPTLRPGASTYFPLDDAVAP